MPETDTRLPRCKEPNCNRRVKSPRKHRCEPHRKKNREKHKADYHRRERERRRIEQGLPPVGVCWDCEGELPDMNPNRRYCVECRKNRERVSERDSRERVRMRRDQVKDFVVRAGRELQKLAMQPDFGQAEIRKVQAIGRGLGKLTINKPEVLASQAERDRRYRERKAA